MAAKTGLKQQCPHCDAVVPIKEAQLGKRIKCPRCGDGFLVEDSDDAMDTKPAKSGRETPNGKAKSKTAPGRQRDDDDKPKLKKKNADGGNTKVVMGVVLGVVAVAALGVAGYFVFFNNNDKPTQKASSSSSTSSPTPSAPAPAPTPTPADPGTVTPPVGQNTPGVAAPSEPVAASSLSLSPLHGMLLNDTDYVVNVPMKEVMKNPLGQTALDHAAVSRALGIPIENIDQVIASGSVAPAWSLVLIRCNKPIKLDDVKQTLKLSPAEGSPRAGQDYFVMRTNFGELVSSFMPDAYASAVNRTTPIAVRLHDAQTLVLADFEPMKQFLDLKGQPKPHDPLPAANPAGAAGTTPGGFPGSGDSPAPLTPNYRTINPRLKLVLDQIEANIPYLFSAAVDFGSDEDGKPIFETSTIGFSLHWPGGKERMVAAVGFGYDTDQRASTSKQAIDTAITQLTPLLARARIKIKTGEVKRPGEKTDPAPGAPGAPGTPVSPTPPGGKAPPGAGETPPGSPSQPGPGTPGELPDAVAEARITIDLKQAGPNISGLINFDLEQKVYDLLFEMVQPYIIRAHGELEMAASNPHPSMLGDAAKKYAEKELQFPAGAARRDAAAARFKRPWAPNQRIGWMAELLPYLGHERVYGRIDFKRSWSDTENLNAAATLIPQFLAPDSLHRDWYIKSSGVRPELAATNYVGIAGVGLDAATYDSANPKRGIFSYDRPLKLSDIDNLSKTIFMIQVPSTARGPWMAGGGTTVRAVPETKSIEAFLPPKGKEMRGTHIIMGDGSVRYVTESIADDVLKALAVIKGKKSEVNIDKMAPAVKPPELKVIGTPPVAEATKAPGS